jgi:23S rRNA-/tRNA-specific pseudouridylate synthase
MQVIKYIPERGEAQNTMLDELFQIFRQNGVSKQYIALFRRQIHSGRTAHATIANPLIKRIYAQIRKRTQLRKKLLQLYYFDYLLFNFTIPS